MPTYCYKCDDCGELFAIVVHYDNRDEDQECIECQQPSSRTWEGFSVNVSTPKTSVTIPEAAAKGRFSKLREQQFINKEIGAARERRDFVTEKKLKAEKKKL